MDAMHDDLPSRRADCALKLARLRAWMQTQGLGAVLLTRRDQIAWLTAGADSHVVLSWADGFAVLVITAERTWFTAYRADAGRLVEEEGLEALGFASVVCTWHGADPLAVARSLAGNGRIGCDQAMAGCELITAPLVRLHEPLSDLDVERVRHLGAQSDALLWQVAQTLSPELTERQVAARIHHAWVDAGWHLDVVLVSGAGRIGRFRHAIPTDAPIGRTVLLHPAGNRWGLHANLTRMVSFGPVDAATRRAWTTCAELHATVARRLRPGVSFAEVLADEQEIHRRHATGEATDAEWDQHFQGGTTGYHLADPTRCLDPAARVAERQSFDYFLTITGAKIEELLLVDRGPAELASTGTWPVTQVEGLHGAAPVPMLLER